MNVSINPGDDGVWRITQEGRMPFSLDVGDTVTIYDEVSDTTVYFLIAQGRLQHANAIDEILLNFIQQRLKTLQRLVDKTKQVSNDSGG
jgi:hypothetical protein